MSLKIVIFGLSITSSWGNGHATTFRALVKALARRGHSVTFLERDVPWYADHRDQPDSPYATVRFYKSLEEAKDQFAALVRDADLVILGSYVPEGIALGDWIVATASGTTAFYDIDTPVTLAGLEAGTVEYISRALIPRFDLYLSFTGGPTLDYLERECGSPCARPLYCAVDLDLHAAAADVQARWALGYLGTYSDDRQPKLQRLLLDPASQLADEAFVVAGAQYPSAVSWPSNVLHIEHLPPRDHAEFYCAQRFTLNVTRADMVARGYSPSVRLFEAAACGVPIISDSWPGLDTFFEPGKEILIAETTEDVLTILRQTSDASRAAIGAAAQNRVQRDHGADRRAQELEDFYREARSLRRTRKEKRAYA